VAGRAERVARNEALFRDVNEVIAQTASGWATARPAVICECAREDCVEPIAIDASQYEAVRLRGERFVVCDGHEDPEFERVIERGDGFAVVEKTGESARIARELDPRAEGS
jgi:hypothetical protein